MSSIKKKIMEINTINLVGRAGREPDVRYFESGSIVANFTLAVNRRSRDEEPDWFNLEIWGKQACFPHISRLNQSGSSSLLLLLTAKVKFATMLPDSKYLTSGSLPALPTRLIVLISIIFFFILLIF